MFPPVAALLCAASVAAPPLWMEGPAPRTTERGDTLRGAAVVLPPPDSLTLKEAIRVALENNPRVAAARWDLASARDDRALAEAGRYPSLRTSGFAAAFTADQRPLPPNAPGQPLAYSGQTGGADLFLEFPLFVSGRLTQQVRSAERTEESYAHLLERTREELEYEVASTFFAILGQKRVVTSVQFSVRALEAHERTVTEMLRLGKAARVDVLRIRVRLADLRQRLLSEQNALEIGKRTLAYLLGGSGTPVAAEPAGDLALIPFQPDIEQDMARALAQRSDMRAALAVRAAREHGVQAVRAERGPAVYLRGSYAQRWAIGADDPPVGADLSPNLGTLSLQVSLPLFDAGAISARVRRGQDLLAATEERIRDLALRIQLEVEEACLQIETARGRVEATQTAIQEGRETLRIETERYRLGKGSVTDVLDAQSELLAAETAYFGALAAYHSAIARYRLMTGETAPW